MNSNLFRLDGRVALVTGASYGIGMAMAKALAEAGATLVFNDRNPDRVTESLAGYRKSGSIAGDIVFELLTKQLSGSILKRSPPSRQ